MNWRSIQGFPLELYLEDVPITYDSEMRSSPRLGGEGPPLEWVLIMKCFDENGLFDVIAAKGPLHQSM